MIRTVTREELADKVLDFFDNIGLKFGPHTKREHIKVECRDNVTVSPRDGRQLKVYMGPRFACRKYIIEPIFTSDPPQIMVYPSAGSQKPLVRVKEDGQVRDYYTITICTK